MILLKIQNFFITVIIIIIIIIIFITKAILFKIWEFLIVIQLKTLKQAYFSLSSIYFNIF